MATRRIFAPSGPSLIQTTWTSQPPLRCFQRRWAQVYDIRFVASRATSVHEKYKEKLERKAREKGLNNVDELKQIYQDKIDALRKKATVPGANAPLSEQAPPTPDGVGSSVPYQAPPAPEPQAQQVPTQAKEYTKGSKDGVKTLSSFIDVEKTSVLPQKEVETIWRLRHVRDPQSLCAVMETDTYRRIAKTARRHPQFILPIPREGQGAEIHFLQWTFPSPTTATVLFTHLAEFKLRGEFAQPHTTVTYHLDLADSESSVVLLEGRVSEDRGIAVDEGRWLLMCLQKFYGFEAHTDAAKANAGKRKKLMEQFSGGDETFKVEELLEEAEKVP
ncbi:hypothetical protein LTR53_006654 [Teratosphaeriaceae sp. CCFEE 6253]|nr:hypothetical protein LTR53_006654 [Teratosphaeriaceae sp. CCFEE 6253]